MREGSQEGRKEGSRRFVNVVSLPPTRLVNLGNIVADSSEIIITINQLFVLDSCYLVFRYFVDDEYFFLMCV